MHCIKIGFDGFKRLSKASCNTDSRLLAFVGPNEAGKSSLLDALVWLTQSTEEELAPRDRTRDRVLEESHVVVEGLYELDDQDKQALGSLQLAQMPDHFVVQRRRDGSRGSDARPFPQRDPRPFDDALRLMDRAERDLRRQIDAADEQAASDEEFDSSGPGSWISAVRTALRDRDAAGWGAPEETDALLDWLREVPATSRTRKPRAPELAAAIARTRDIAASEHPSTAARQILNRRLPRFVKFTDEHRELRRDYDLDEAFIQDPPPALAHLLTIADLDLVKLYEHLQNQDGSSSESAVEFANDRLRAFFEQAWNQSRVTVRLKLSDFRLEVWLRELDGDGGITDIEERSEGLLMFVAVATFVAAQQTAVPPILLIDEAETHLHFDAQADLVGVLLKQVNATQVFYSTHSPGCLPTDLGTGIRLVRRTEEDRTVSSVQADFWTNEAPGFAPLLYAMGASAAAFSACRRAVLAEGAADMVLLPTLIRLAADLDELSYQVAPGLANARAFGMNVEEVAARVVYLTDGDAEGDKYRQDLRDADVPNARVFSLPRGMASEDLVQRDVFIEIVNTLLPKGAMLSSADLADNQPVAKALEDWLRERDLSLGHVAIAYGLINNRSKLRFAPGAKQALRRLHEKIEIALA